MHIVYAEWAASSQISWYVLDHTALEVYSVAFGPISFWGLMFFRKKSRKQQFLVMARSSGIMYEDQLEGLLPWIHLKCL